ncbi:MAG: ParB/RepB/Spo0J family partition protein [Gammaproteobacteria bacterium]|nr:ParB/RepB/Spo0J family partition protein [Gammaproteobacteria bacterium]
MAKKKVFQISNALTEGLEETVTAAHNYNGELRVEIIPLKKIELDPENPRDLILTFEDLYNGIDKGDKNYLRKLSEKNSLLSLSNSIKDQGIINPILVYKHGNKYRLVAGERRTLASILSDKSDIQAKILDSKPTELKISLLQWVENVERKDLSLWERLKNLEKIIYSYSTGQNIPLDEITATNLSHLLGCSLPHAMNYIAVLTADNKLKTLIQHNQLKNLEKAALLATIQSQSTKDTAIEACLAGATLKKLKGILNQEKQSKSILKQPIILKGRGRQATFVNLGTTKKVQVAKLIIDSILDNAKVTHLKPHFSELNWSDYKSINHAFKQLLETLEQIEA